MIRLYDILKIGQQEMKGVQYEQTAFAVSVIL